MSLCVFLKFITKTNTFAKQKIIKCVLWELTCSTLRAGPRMLQNRVPGASWLYFAGWPQNAAKLFSGSHLAPLCELAPEFFKTVFWVLLGHVKIGRCCRNMFWGMVVGRCRWEFSNEIFGKQSCWKRLRSQMERLGGKELGELGG